MPTSFHCEQAWLPDGVADDVLVSVSDAGVIENVAIGAPPASDSYSLRGVVLPGFANAHSHAFHRALRGRTHAEGGSFWTWRERMYAVAAVLDPSSMYALARAVYAEMVLSGTTAVGEFHYLHHGPGGQPYDEANVMGEALRAAASDAGLRLTLLDTCYLTGAIARPLEGTQLRFGDRDVDSWAARVADLVGDRATRIGAAVHSVRAVPADDLSTVARAAEGRPLHVHVSEQPAENEQCVEAYGCTPTGLLHEHGVLSEHTTAVHATHLTDDDIALLGGARVSACFCPTTERDLADGIGPARRLADAGSPICLGSDQHAVIDAFEEVRGLEMHERLASRQRGRFTPGELLDALTRQGHAAIGWPEAGQLAVGSLADLVAVSTQSVRTAGSRSDQILFSASAPDVTDVVVGGHAVVRGGEHLALGHVAPLLARAVDDLWDAVAR